ncbi:MAG: hypothetical protein BGO39_21805 [Chloroflexi bacterium 54-19]|nr:MAG: hypothetical protein BGO39_21805 [Chloroflexi bacterium 54-19]
MSPSVSPSLTPGLTTEDKKVTICHATGSQTNPYVLITIDENAVDAHKNEHNGDIVPAPVTGCPTARTSLEPTRATAAHTPKPTPTAKASNGNQGNGNSGNNGKQGNGNNGNSGNKGGGNNGNQGGGNKGGGNK